MSELASLTKEVNHWKALAETYQASLAAVQEELIDYQTGSRELETELETQLDQAEGKNRELLRSNQRLRNECDSLRAKLDKLQKERGEQVQRLETELSNVVTERNDLQQYVTKLEQQNDTLEKAQREALASLEDFERRLNESIEKNALLECEMDEKDVLQAYIQRLKDETRDLRLELNAKERAEHHAVSSNGSVSYQTSQLNGETNAYKRRLSLPSHRALSETESQNCFMDFQVLCLVPVTKADLAGDYPLLPCLLSFGEKIGRRRNDYVDERMNAYLPLAC